MNNWQPDPYGRHEERYVDATGTPTRLVRDGKTESYDDMSAANGSAGQAVAVPGPKTSAPQDNHNPMSVGKTQRYCGHCGSALNAEHSFCTGCGRAVSTPITQADVQSNEPLSSPTSNTAETHVRVRRSRRSTAPSGGRLWGSSWLVSRPKRSLKSALLGRSELDRSDSAPGCCLAALPHAIDGRRHGRRRTTQHWSFRHAHHCRCSHRGPEACCCGFRRTSGSVSVDRNAFQLGANFGFSPRRGLSDWHWSRRNHVGVRVWMVLAERGATGSLSRRRRWHFHWWTESLR